VQGSTNHLQVDADDDLLRTLTFNVTAKAETLILFNRGEAKGTFAASGVLSLTQECIDGINVITDMGHPHLFADSSAASEVGIALAVNKNETNTTLVFQGNTYKGQLILGGASSFSGGQGSPSLCISTPLQPTPMAEAEQSGLIIAAEGGVHINFDDKVKPDPSLPYTEVGIFSSGDCEINMCNIPAKKVGIASSKGDTLRVFATEELDTMGKGKMYYVQNSVNPGLTVNSIGEVPSAVAQCNQPTTVCPQYASGRKVTVDLVESPKEAYAMTGSFQYDESTAPNDNIVLIASLSAVGGAAVLGAIIGVVVLAKRRSTSGAETYYSSV